MPSMRSIFVATICVSFAKAVSLGKEKAHEKANTNLANVKKMDVRNTVENSATLQN